MQDEKESSRGRGKGIKSHLEDLWEDFIRAGILRYFYRKSMWLKRGTGQFACKSKLHSVHLSCIWCFVFFLQNTQHNHPLLHKQKPAKSQVRHPSKPARQSCCCIYLDGYTKCLSEEISALEYGNIYATEHGLDPHLN